MTRAVVAHTIGSVPAGARVREHAGAHGRVRGSLAADLTKRRAVDYCRVAAAL